MSEMDRRSDEPGRREEDRRWLKVQEQIMNLVTAERTDQQELSAIKIEVSKLADHVDDLDEHLRGVAGHESLDSRVVLLERASTANTVLLKEINCQLKQLTTDVAAIQIHRAIDKEVSKTKAEKFSEWLKFWGPIIIAAIALIIPLTKMVLEHREKTLNEVHYRPDERLRRQIEADKRSRRAKEVAQKLKALEKIQDSRQH